MGTKPLPEEPPPAPNETVDAVADALWERWERDPVEEEEGVYEDTYSASPRARRWLLAGLAALLLAGAGMFLLAGRRSPDSRVALAPGSEAAVEEAVPAAVAVPDAGELRPAHLEPSDAAAAVVVVDPTDVEDSDAAPPARSHRATTAVARVNRKGVEQPVDGDSDDEPVRTTGAEWQRMAEIHLAAGRSDLAEAAFFRASTSTDHTGAAGGTLGLAEIELRRRHYAQAAKQARRAVALGAAPKISWRLVAQAACALGDQPALDEANGKLGALGSPLPPCAHSAGDGTASAASSSTAKTRAGSVN